MNYFPYEFKFVSILSDWALSGDTKFLTKINSFFRKQWTPGLRYVMEKVEEELCEYGLPRVISVNVFNRPAHDEQIIHIDYLKLLNGTVIPTSVAYNIPIIGNDSSIMRWWDGEYELVYFEKEQPPPLPRISTYRIKWITQPLVVDELYISKPHFVRIDQPHNVQIGNQDRILISLRFESKVTIEEASECVGYTGYL